MGRQSDESVLVQPSSPGTGSTSSIRELTDRVIEEIRKRNRQ